MLIQVLPGKKKAPQKKAKGILKLFVKAKTFFSIEIDKKEKELWSV